MSNVKWMAAGAVVLVGFASTMVLSGQRGTALPADQQAPPGAQVSNVQAVHRNGQTFVTWKEIEAPALEAEPSAESLIRLKRELGKRIFYRIYRSLKPIVSISGLAPVGTTGPLSAWNTDFHGIDPPAQLKSFRYIVADNQAPIGPGLGLYVHNPRDTGPAYYAVTAVVDGRESVRVDDANRTSVPQAELVQPGTPVLQRVAKPADFRYVANPELRYYTRWEAPPNANRENQPIDYLVAVPPRVKSPAPVGLHLHAYGGNLHGDFGWWYNAEQGAILVSSVEIPYDWWTGYHELLGRQPLETVEDWRKGVVRPYTQTRLLSFVDWLASTRPIDRTRTFVAGNSMGGSGSIMLAIRRPEIAWAISWVGVHRPHMTPQFKGSYERVYGPRDGGVLFENGTPVWDYFDDATYLRQHPGRDVGFITFSNGKNDNDIGWQQAVDFLLALQETRQPHLFYWGQAGHGQRAFMPAGGDERTMPLDIRNNQSLPAFTRSTLDDDPGDGSQSTGAASGQINWYLEWDPQSIVDTPERWEVSVGVTASSPRKEGRTDITPRRLQQFKPKPGETLHWKNNTGSRTLQSGEIVVDGSGVATVPSVEVRTGRTRLVLERGGAPGSPR